MKQYEGMPVEEIAKLRGDADPAVTCIQLMAEEGGRIGGIFHTMSEEDVRLVMKQPWVSIASDGSAINLQATGFPHPRNYSTNARVLGYYVRDQYVLTLEDAVRKVTTLPAQILGTTDRGQIHPGPCGPMWCCSIRPRWERRIRTRNRSRMQPAFRVLWSTA